MVVLWPLIGVATNIPLSVFGEVVASWGGLVAEVAATLICLRLVARWSSLPASALVPLGEFDSRVAVPVGITAIGFSILNAAWVQWATVLGLFPSWFDDLLARAFPDPLPTLLSFVLVGPVIEELLFRGGLLGALCKRYSANRAIVFSTAGFAVSHVLPAQLVGAVAAGLLLGWLRVRTGSLWLPIFGHIVFNGAAAVRHVPVLIEPVGSESVTLPPLWLVLVGIAGAILGPFWVRWVLSLKEGARQVPFPPDHAR